MKKRKDNEKAEAKQSSKIRKHLSEDIKDNKKSIKDDKKLSKSLKRTTAC